MLRIAIPTLALTMLGAPMLSAALTETPTPPMERRAMVSVSKEQAVDIAKQSGMDMLTEVTLSGGAWRVSGETPAGKVIHVDVSAQSGGVHVLEYAPPVLSPTETPA